MTNLLGIKWGGTPNTFKLDLEYGPASTGLSLDAAVRLPKALATLSFEWDANEEQQAIIERFVQRQSSVVMNQGEERVHATITAIDTGVQLQLQCAMEHPALRCISGTRVSSGGNVSEPLLKALLQHCQVDTIWKLKGSEGFGNFWCSCVEPHSLTSLRYLNLSYSGLSVLPANVGNLTSLRILRLSHNKLAALPPELGQLIYLEVLAADANLLTSVPVELRRCVALKELNLEGNKIATPVLDLRPMKHTLQSLQLYGNPLEYLPELSPCSQLRSLSLANVRIMADLTYTRWEVEVGPLAYMARSHKLAPLFRLTFRRASLQHPLLAGALGRIAEDPDNCELIAKEEVAMQQLVVMAMSDNSVVVQQACKTLGHLAACGVSTVRKLMAHDVVGAIYSLVNDVNQDSQLCGLTVLSALATSSDDISAQLLTDQLMLRLHTLIHTGDPSVRQAALWCLSALCYCSYNRRMVRSSPDLLASVAELAQAHTSTSSAGAGGSLGGKQHTSAAQHPNKKARHDQTASAHTGGGQLSAGTRSSPHFGYASDPTRLSALRVLAVLGEHEAVQEALQQSPIKNRGVRVLALDGGGMKGVATVQILRALQQRLTQPLTSYFDLVVGTSTGAIVAVTMAMLGMSLENVEAVYTQLGQKVFNAPRTNAAGTEEAASWKDSLYRVYRNSSQSIRVAVYGSKHDPSAFESLLQEFADIQKHGCLTNQMIDATSLPGIPKVALVSTLTSVTPAEPFLFRTYELPLGSEALAAHIAACNGSSRMPVWQAVRASASAPYYLDDFAYGEDRFQDGAVTANNPALIALQQARLLWPSLPVECLVSLGCGVGPSHPRERSVSSYLDTGSVLIESACSTDRVHEALATTLDLLPSTHYFRFQPIDERFAVQLDDVSASTLVKLQAAAKDYCAAHSARLDSLAQLLKRAVEGEAEGEQAREQGSGSGAAGGSSRDVEMRPTDGGIRLGTKRGLLLLCASVDRQVSAHLHTPDLNSRTVSSLCDLPQLVRSCDISATLQSRAHKMDVDRADTGAALSSLEEPAGRAMPQQSFSFGTFPAAADAVSPAKSQQQPATGTDGRRPVNHMQPPPQEPAFETQAGTGEGPLGGEQAGGAGDGKEVANSLTSPRVSVSSSIFNYFLPRWGLSSSGPQPTGEEAAAGVQPSPTPFLHSTPSITPPPVQVLEVEPSATDAAAAVAGAVAEGMIAAGESDAGTPSGCGPGLAVQTPLPTPTSATATNNTPSSLWFPWGSPAGPSSPMLSPGMAGLPPMPHSLSPQRRDTTDARTTTGFTGSHIFRSRSKTDSGPKHLQTGDTTVRATSGLTSSLSHPSQQTSARPLSSSITIPPSSQAASLGLPAEYHKAASLHEPSSVPEPRVAMHLPSMRASCPSSLTALQGQSSVDQSLPSTNNPSAVSSPKLPLSPSASSLNLQGRAAHPSSMSYQQQQAPGGGGEVAGEVTSWEEIYRQGSEQRLGGQLPDQASQQPTQQPPTDSNVVPTDALPQPSLGYNHQLGSMAFLQDLDVECSAGGAPGQAAGAGQAAGQGLTSGAVVQGLLQDLAGQVAAVHLCLEADPDAAALITSWSSEVVPLVEPGVDASALVSALGGDPAHQSLAQVTGGAGSFRVGSQVYTKLSMQEVALASGQQVRSILFSVSRPAGWLTAEDVHAAGVDWSELLVTSTAVIPRPLLEALLRAGVLAVVSPEQAPSPEQEAALPGVLHSLLHQVLTGMSLLEAVRVAEAGQGGVCSGLLACHHT